MKISKLLFAISVVFISLNSSAQLHVIVNKADSIKSLEYTVYKLKIKNTDTIKTKRTLAYDYYPIQYPRTKFYYNKRGDLIKKDNPNQKDTTYYNSKKQKIKRVLYPGNSKDSISIFYSYDSQGNIETENMKASDPKLNYELDANYYSYESLIDTFYTNYYLSENDSTEYNQFESVKMELNTYYRLYNDENKLVKEKYVTTTKNAFPYKADSTFHIISYHYTEENKISKTTIVNKHINALGKNYASISTEEHSYLNQGLIHEIKYYNDDNLSREERMVRNTEGVLTKYSNHWISPDRTTTYLYNSKGDLTAYTATRKNKIVRQITLKYTYNNRGDWIKCIHYNKKDKPEYLVERMIAYY